MDMESIKRNRSNSVIPSELAEKDGKELIGLSRLSLSRFLNDGVTLNGDACGERFRKYAGVFVTLKIDGDLRGCIGYPYPVLPLCEAVIHSSISAAVEDPRFNSVTSGELERITVEVTVLGFPERLDQYKSDFRDSVELGKHGLMVKSGFYSGLLLPQVAIEESMNIDQFIAATLLKAGLPKSEFMKKTTELYYFEGRIFSEKE